MLEIWNAHLHLTHNSHPLAYSLLVLLLTTAVGVGLEFVFGWLFKRSYYPFDYLFRPR